MGRFQKSPNICNGSWKCESNLCRFYSQICKYFRNYILLSIFADLLFLIKFDEVWQKFTNATKKFLWKLNGNILDSCCCWRCDGAYFNLTMKWKKLIHTSSVPKKYNFQTHSLIPCQYDVYQCVGEGGQIISLIVLYFGSLLYCI